MKYEPVEFSKLSEAIAYVEGGGKLYQLDAGHAYTLTPTSLAAMSGNLATGGVISAFTDAPKPNWYEVLDGTVDNGVLCWVDDEPLPNSLRGHASLIVSKRSDGFVGSMDRHWYHATPLTRTEIQKFMDNALEES